MTCVPNSNQLGLIAVLVACVPGCATGPSRIHDAIRETQVSEIVAHYVLLRRGNIEAVIVDNAAVNDDVLPRHLEGYNGVALLRHGQQGRNLFVPQYAGLNFEHIHDGTTQEDAVLFEPRRAPMTIRRIDEYTAELHQQPTPHWQLESRLRYALIDDQTIELSVECIPRARTFAHGYIGIFFASYVQTPESPHLYFHGVDPSSSSPRLIQAVTPSHGVLATHRALGDQREFAHDPVMPIPLVFGFSNYRYTEPWYYGISHGMALLQVFRMPDQARFSQSPSGGGGSSPAWDFQYLIQPYQVGRAARFVMRAVYLPFESPEQVGRLAAQHRAQIDWHR